MSELGTGRVQRSTCDHDWKLLDGYFWYRCTKCEAVA